MKPWKSPALKSGVLLVRFFRPERRLRNVSIPNRNKEMFEAALAALNAKLALKGFFFSTNNPYFFTAPYDPTYTAPAGACPTKNLAVYNRQTGGTTTWTWNGTACVRSIGIPGTAGTVDENMGAAYNLNLLAHDPSAYTHNRVYAKRLIWDAIKIHTVLKAGPQCPSLLLGFTFPDLLLKSRRNFPSSYKKEPQDESSGETVFPRTIPPTAGERFAS
jgi:hypothetical protein